MKTIYIGVVTGLSLALLWQISYSLFHIAEDIRAIRETLAPVKIEFRTGVSHKPDILTL